ncbi:MAG: phosphonate metabolism protein [Desulfobulbaceae bacterium]|nr:MAG: phosphonate metabolism protein [Desulfobulbaceae bacterium]
MSYVAIKGGAEAIRYSKDFFHSELDDAKSISDQSLVKGLRYACDRVMSEGALYTETLAAEAIRKTGGDLLEAAFYVRAHRSTCQRIGSAEPIDTNQLRIKRRISSAFKDIKGGQILGPSCDYVIRLFSSLKSSDNTEAPLFEETDIPNIRVESALTPLRRDDRVAMLENEEQSPFDVTRSFPLPPYPRSAVMQIMARGETGSLLAFGYTSMRGYGDVHPTIGDLRLGEADILFTHPFTGNRVKIGSIRVTACETVGSFNPDPKDGKLRLAVGYGFCFGFNETKAISMSVLDLAMSHKGYSVGGQAIAANPEIVVHHVDAIESMGFTNHFKLPHYVTFQADLQVLNNARKNNDDR